MMLNTFIYTRMYAELHALVPSISFKKNCLISDNYTNRFSSQFCYNVAIVDPKSNSEFGENGYLETRYPTNVATLLNWDHQPGKIW